MHVTLCTMTTYVALGQFKIQNLLSHSFDNTEHLYNNVISGYVHYKLYSIHRLHQLFLLNITLSPINPIILIQLRGGGFIYQLTTDTNLHSEQKHNRVFAASAISLHPQGLLSMS